MGNKLKNKISARLPDDLEAKIRAEARVKSTSVTEIIREKIELGFEVDVIRKAMNELRMDLKRMTADQSSTYEDIRRIQNLSFWILIIMAEHCKASIGIEQFYKIKDLVEAKYQEFQETEKNYTIRMCLWKLFNNKFSKRDTGTGQGCDLDKHYSENT